MIRPINDQVLLEKLEAIMPDTTSIVLPENAKERPVVRARVLAVGPGRWGKRGRVEPGVKAGDVVVFNQYDNAVHEPFPKQLIVRECDLLGVIEDES